MKPLALLASLAFAATAAAETPPPAPAPAQDNAQKARPALKLNLDEVEPARPRITFEPRDDKKKDEAASNLPGLGGRPSRDWVEPSKPVFPQNTGGAEPPVK